MRSPPTSPGIIVIREASPKDVAFCDSAKEYNY